MQQSRNWLILLPFYAYTGLAFEGDGVKTSQYVSTALSLLNHAKVNTVFHLMLINFENGSHRPDHHRIERVYVESTKPKQTQNPLHPEKDHIRVSCRTLSKTQQKRRREKLCLPLRHSGRINSPISPVWNANTLDDVHHHLEGEDEEEEEEIEGAV